VVGISLYFVLGSLLEERKLHHIFGASYEAYQRQVPWLIPFVKGISRR
jgi:protein-S-isoprenylcysteine O-methyltransferase Ste14